MPSDTDRVSDEDRATELRNGRYVFVRTLGEGAQGETFEAVDKREGTLVAIKKFRIGKAKSWKDVELAEREARILAALEHPRLPRYVEHFEEGGALYLVMQRIEGESVHARRKAGHPSDATEVVRMLEDASDAFAYLHGRSPPVIHRDVKPGNVLRKPDGSFAFVDFGSVRDRLRPEGGSTVVGTFGYMAPEQFQGRASPATDVYGIGATALAMLTGREPEELPHRGLAIDVARAVPPGTPRELVAVLESMLRPDPDERASSVAEALAHWSRRPRRPRAVRAAHDVEARATSKQARRDREREREHHASKRERREAKRERAWREVEERRERHRERQRERAHRRQRRHALRDSNVPFVWRAFALLGLRIAQVAVALAVGVFVPILLVLLSPLFGPALRRAAKATRRASVRARRAIDRAADHVAGIAPDGASAADASTADASHHVRVSSTHDPRARVATDEAEEADARRARVPDEAAWEDEADREDDAPGREARKSRS